MSSSSNAVGNFLETATKTASDFQSQMSKVSMISNVTDNEIKRLSLTAREWGSKTKFGATEAGQALEYMGMAGWKTQEMIEGLPGILNLATASGQELKTTSNIVTTALTDFGLRAKYTSEFADILTVASANSNTDISTLGESFKYCAPVCSNLGISVKDTAFALSLMAKQGINGSNSGTALKTMFTNLTNIQGPASNAMKQLNIALLDQNGQVKEGKIIFDELRASFKSLTDAQKAQYTSTIFGKEAMRGALSVINASDGDYNKLYKNLSNCSNAAENTANKMQNNLKGSLDNLKSAFEELQISLVDTLLPAFTSIIKFITKLINKFNALPKPVKDLIAKLLMIVAIAAPVLLTFGKIIKSISGVIKIFSSLSKGVKLVLNAFKILSKGIGAVTKIFRIFQGGIKIFSLLPSLLSPPILIAVAIIAGLGFVVYEVIKHWDQLKEAGKNFINAICDIFKGVGEFFSSIIDGWKNIWHGFCNFMGKIGHWICDGLLGGLKKGFNKILGFIHNMASGIKNTFKKVLGINSPSRVFKEYGGFIGEGLCEGLDGQESVINSKFKGLGDKIKGLGNVKPYFYDLGLNDVALSGGSNNELNNLGLNNNFGITQDIKMYITIPDTKQEGATELANQFKAQTEMSLKNSMVDLFMKDALRN